MISSNDTERIQSMGLSSKSSLRFLADETISEGGPVLKNKLWFFGAFRKARYDRPIANTFAIPAGTPNIPAAFAACRAIASPISVSP